MRNYLPWIAVLIWSCDYATSSDVDDLENEVVTLRGTITGLATEIDSLERELASVPGDLATAQQTGTENSADLDRLEGDVDRLESTVGQVQADVAAAQTDIETLNGTPTEVQPLAQGETELQIRSPVAAVRSSRFSGESTATFTTSLTLVRLAASARINHL